LACCPRDLADDRHLAYAALMMIVGIIIFIVAPEVCGKCFGEEPAEPVRLLQMLRSFSAKKMMCLPVDPKIGSAKNDEASLIESLTAT
jgi:hypothetical protein